MKVIKVEDFEIWKESIELVVLVYNLIKNTDLKRDFVLSEQIKKSVISIPSNIAEGFERNNNNEFKHFLNIAKGSIGELKTQVYIALRLELINKHQFDELNNKIIRLSSKISNLITHLRKKQK